MKILIGCSSPPGRGAGIWSYTKNFCEALVGVGAEVHLASPVPHDWGWINDYSIKHYESKYEDDPIAAARRILEYISDRSIDGVINNDNPLIQSITPGLRCPVIVIGHLDRYSIAALACYRHKWSDYVVAISSDMQRTFSTRYGVPPYKCPVILNGITDPGHDGNFERKSRENLQVIYAGEYSRRKGADLMEKAIRRGERDWKGISLHWYGNVPEKVSARCKDMSFVSFYGRVPRDRLLGAMREADVFLLSSRAEGCPMVMLEAMSMGVVPIASDGLGAMRWLVENGLEGFICNLSDWPRQTTECLRFLRENTESLRDMKMAVRLKYEKNFQMGAVIKEFLRLLSNPTVDRSIPKREFEVLYWHRPLYSSGRKATLLDRVRMRVGALREAGTLRL